jgi:hypothetical protein
MLAKCPCQYCHNAIEFEVSEFEESGSDLNSVYGQNVQCPHCGKDTILVLEKSKSQAALVDKPKSESPKKKVSASWFSQFKQAVFGEEPEPQNSKGRPAPTVFLTISSVVLFVIGCGLVFDGCASELLEEAKPEGSAIRQTVFAIQYGFGFVTIALSLILGALIRLIQK